MTRHAAIKDRLHSLIRSGAVTLGGNCKLKIYGLLSCRSGKNMKIENRVFFRDEATAIAHGYRPCGHCMKEAYKKWKEANL
jgi:methylphosphotriester-DNA--protein-cysteine methyltransferase